MLKDIKAPFPPLLGLIVGILASSTASIFIRNAQEEAPSLVIAAYRLSLASLLLLPVLFCRGRNDLKRLTRKHLSLIAIAGISLALHFATWISSLEYTSVASSAVLVSMSPLFVAILAPFVLREPTNPRLRLGILVAFAGSVLIGVGDSCTVQNGLQCPSLSDFFGGAAIKGDLLALAGALNVVAYLLIGRYLRGKIPLLPYISLTYSVAALGLTIAVLHLKLAAFHYSPKIYLWFALLALFPQLVGHNSINWVLRYLPAAYVSITLLIEPVAATTWAYLFLEEQPSRFLLFGGLLVLFGIGIASLPQKEPKG